MTARQARWLSYVLPVILAGLLLYWPFTSAADHLLHPPLGEHTRPALTYIQAHQKPGDVIYVYTGARAAFGYYGPQMGLDRSDYVIGVSSRSDPQGYFKDVAALQGRPRVWVLFSHVYNWGGTDEEAVIVQHLDQIGTRINTLQLPGAALYLYDLTTK
jgi:hypothetical protein